MRRKEERSKQGQTNKAKQHSTPNMYIYMYECRTQHVIKGKRGPGIGGGAWVYICMYSRKAKVKGMKKRDKYI